jgi:hypothetical protein
MTSPSSANVEDTKSSAANKQTLRPEDISVVRSVKPAGPDNRSKVSSAKLQNSQNFQNN